MCKSENRTRQRRFYKLFGPVGPREVTCPGVKIHQTGKKRALGDAWSLSHHRASPPLPPPPPDGSEPRNCRIENFPLIRGPSRTQLFPASSFREKEKFITFFVERALAFTDALLLIRLIKAGRIKFRRGVLCDTSAL